MFAALVLLSFVAQPIVPSPLRAEFEKERLSQLVRAVGREATTREGVPGVAIAVLRGDEILAEGYFGSADAGGAVEESTRFEVGSLTRQFTAAAVLNLAAKGEFALDDELAKHLTEFPTTQGSPTIRQILAFRSGIPGWTAVLAKHPDAETREYGEVGFLKCFTDVPFAFAPGTGESTDTLGYVLLAILVERVTREPFPDWIQRNVVDPAGFESTAFCPVGDRPAGYAEDCKAVDGERSLDIALPGAPKNATRSLCANARDVARWQRALHSGVVLDEAALRLFLAPSGSAKGPDEQGCAVRTTKLEDVRRHAHSGGAKGFRVATAYYPAAEISVAVLANCATAEVERIEDEIARVALGLPLPEGEFPLLPIEEQRLPGSYLLATTQIRVFTKDGHLWLEEPGQSATHLRSRRRGEFAIENERDARVVFDLEGDKAAWFTLTRSGSTSRAIRME